MLTSRARVAKVIVYSTILLLILLDMNVLRHVPKSNVQNSAAVSKLCSQLNLPTILDLW